MFRFLTARHIQKAHKRYKKDEPSLKAIYEFLDNLRLEQPYLKYIQLLRHYPGGIKVHIVPFESFGKRCEAAVPPARWCIMLNPEWAARMYYTQIGRIGDATAEQIKTVVECEDELAFAVGHEMGHVIYDTGCDNPLTLRKRRRFYNWVNEVFADFMSLQFAMNRDREVTIEALKRKQSCRKKDKNTLRHPSYALRMKYIKDFTFGEALIREIANDCGMKNQKVIERVLKKYDLSPQSVSNINVLHLYYKL